MVSIINIPTALAVTIGKGRHAFRDRSVGQSESPNQANSISVELTTLSNATVNS
jgi:hypothetical protein